MSDNATAAWPLIPGSYVVGDPDSPVAVCTLTSERLMGPLAKLSGVAISGMVYTANLGITRIIVNVTSNPAIRFLLICGRDSALFKPGQSLTALSDNGVDPERKIIGASGYEPVLQSVTPEQVEQFRKQVEVVDWTGEEDLAKIQERVVELAAHSPGRFATAATAATGPLSEEKFVPIRPGGQREPLIYDPKGYFVISVDRKNEEIVLRHYNTDHKPAHEMRGRGATSMVLGLLREGLVSQLSHAGYLGEELAKAQIALQFGLRYDQDRLLRPQEGLEKAEPEKAAQSNSASSGSGPKASSKPPVEPMTLQQFESASLESRVDLVMTVMDLPQEHVMSGVFLAMDEAQPFTVYHRTNHSLQATWSPATKVIMGQANEIVVGALLRIVGKRNDTNKVDAEAVIVLTKVAHVV